VDYVRIRESRDGIDDDPEGAGQLLGAQVEGTTTWNEMYGVCYEDSCTHGTQFVLRGRSCMRMSAWSVSVMSSVITCVCS